MSSEDTSYPCDITAEKFQKLHPVHYRIFDLLKKEIPVTLIQTCHQMYDELIPKIYERIIITEKNYDSITGGASIELQEWYLEEREEMVEQEVVSEEELEKWDEHLPDLKDQALSHVRFVSFMDIEGTTRFISENADCAFGCCAQSRYHFKNAVFAICQMVHLGKDVVLPVVDYHVTEDYYWSKEAGLQHRMAEFLEVFFRESDLHIVCVDWPEDWDRDDWATDEEEDEHWALRQGMKTFLMELASFECIRHIVLHLKIHHLPHVESALDDMTQDCDLTFFYLTVTQRQARIAKGHLVLSDIHNRFVSLREDYDIHYLPIRYSLPDIKELAESIEEYGDDLVGEEAAFRDILKERLEIRKEECECRIK
ncbi:hypothetical protein V865_004474 [Kwoniella europaea PYCC6329]|uniref:Uncharacterized protein n=1 Tax=Kwoniella europaea PYCC6329 TaxID=1423913 RepID=A0AAX4KJZ7_9TREE